MTSTDIPAYKTEDEVREEAKSILGFDDDEKNVKQGTGQLTTFNQLGFKGVSDKPDGWYLPNDKNAVAIILETKNSKVDIASNECRDEIFKNIDITLKKYKKVIGILYNGADIRVFKNEQEIIASDTLQPKKYYISLFQENKIDQGKIYRLTKRINDGLHFDFGIKNLYHRMVFTACALVADRYGATMVPGMDFTTLHTSIHSTLAKSLEQDKKQNLKLDLLLEVYSEIKMNSTENQNAIDSFIKCVNEISESINSDYWNGEDVMGIFFNEFNRYKTKTENGQVFTPDHITSFMYRLINVHKDDVILDAACGSGAFLVKAMCNMIKEAGGVNSKESKTIKQHQLYGIEFDREIYALACANMLIHKDGKTNLVQMDSRTKEACDWIKSKPITKVLMNPPFENKYGCMTIVENVLDNVPKNTQCAFILPDKKLEKIGKKKPKHILKHHTLEKIIKLPEKTFIKEGVTTSIFIFTAGVPQNDKEIFACYIEDDGLETVKNQGRQDIKNRWQGIEDFWVDVIRKQAGSDTIEWLDPNQHLSYQMPEIKFSINEDDYSKTVADYLMYKNGSDMNALGEKLLNNVFYSSSVKMENGKLSIQIDFNNPGIDITDWKPFEIGRLFTIEKPEARVQTKYFEGNVPFVASGNYNNGIQGYVQPEESDVLDKGGCITISPVDGSAFYQPQDFLGRGGAGSSIMILRSSYINQFSAQFICTAIRIYFSKYVYNDMGTPEKLKKEHILLPVVHNNDGSIKIDNEKQFSDGGFVPDWTFMESFMKEKFDQMSDSINLLQKCFPSPLT